MTKKERMKIYNARPDVKARKLKYSQSASGKRTRKVYQKSDRGKQLQSQANRRALYKISDERVAELLAAQDGCAICHTWVPGGVGGWHVDHDHACCPGDKSCGKCVRGILCNKHNLAIGMFGDNVTHLQAAVIYLTAKRGSG
jgi:hypothetical protein